MLFDSCVNYTRQESNCVRETLREISKILQISGSTAQRPHACETSKAFKLSENAQPAEVEPKEREVSVWEVSADQERETRL